MQDFQKQLSERNKAKDELYNVEHQRAIERAKGHHIGHFLPPEKDVFTEAYQRRLAAGTLGKERQADKIDADKNLGAQMMMKMGWADGKGLGAEEQGRSNPIMTGPVKKDTLGLGAASATEPDESDDLYDLYKKRMMMAYRHRPNPLNNPRTAYY